MASVWQSKDSRAQAPKKFLDYGQVDGLWKQNPEPVREPADGKGLISGVLEVQVLLSYPRLLLGWRWLRTAGTHVPGEARPPYL